MTDAEQAFLTMAKMAGIEIELVDEYAGERIIEIPNDPFDYATVFGPDMSDTMAIIYVLQREYCSDLFPIVASTFLKLVEERPELRPHYDRAKEAWETSQ